MTLSQAHSQPWLPIDAGTNPDSPQAAWRIIAITPDRLVEAVDRLVAQGPQPDRAHTQRFLDYARTNAVRLDLLWSMVDQTEAIQATVLAVPSPGRTAMVFASPPRSPGMAIAVGRLLDHACGHLATLDVHLAQALFDPSDALDQEGSLAGGFVRLAQLSYLERPVPRVADSQESAWPAGVTIEAYRDISRQAILEVLDASYDGTLDCPGLRGLRRTEDILEGHRASGRFEPRLWTLLRVDGRPSGVLLLNPSPAHHSIELVYLGLAAQARGRGLGRQLLRHGLRLLSGRPERTITLAVDEANVPALRLYRAHGFRTALRRIAMIRPLRGAAAKS